MLFRSDFTCIESTVQTASFEISGSVTGDINASERVEICSGASVTGDISTARLRIANNVEFEGQITMLDEQPDENIFSVASKEYKDALVLRSDVIE